MPTFPYERRLSKIDTLHLAIAYIALLKDILKRAQPGEDTTLFVVKSLQEMKEPSNISWFTSGKYKYLFYIVR